MYRTLVFVHKIVTCGACAVAWRCLCLLDLLRTPKSTRSLATGMLGWVERIGAGEVVNTSF